MASAPASPLAANSTLAMDILARFPAEIIARIVDNLHPSLIYFHLFAEPRSSPVQSSSEQCQRVREVCISHNVKFGCMDILTYAVSSNDKETVEQMLKEASTNSKTSERKGTVVKHAPRSLWKTWLSWSVSRDYHDIASQLLCIDGIASYLNRGDRSFDKLLLPAARDQNTTLMRLLLENGANPDITNDHKDTPLHFAAKHNNKAAIIMLVQYQSDVNRLGSAGNTPLMWAIEHDDIDMVKVYLDWPLLNLNKHGYLEEHKDTHGRTPLMLCLAKMAGLKDMTAYTPTFKELLIAKGVDLQTFSKEYETVFKDVLKEYDTGFWQELLEQMDS
ncbi:hypothetical protein TrVFT333_010154 [Trichoderma virens FT-333]|nr:hypothetical protein TrVFT333_010154 [Trichoderma virens FT-333]